jgi:hypothetical protein
LYLVPRRISGVLVPIMNKAVIMVVIRWLLVLSWFSFRPNRPAANGAQAPQAQWESMSTYAETSSLITTTGDLLNVLGDEGWELSSAVSYADRTLFTLKRRKS